MQQVRSTMEFVLSSSSESSDEPDVYSLKDAKIIVASLKEVVLSIHQAGMSGKKSDWFLGRMRSIAFGQLTEAVSDEDIDIIFADSTSRPPVRVEVTH